MNNQKKNVEFNVQSMVLNEVRKTQSNVMITFVDGSLINGKIKSFDPFCILVDTDKGDVLVYKHGIVSIFGYKEEAK